VSLLPFPGGGAAVFFRGAPGPLNESHAAYDNSNGCPKCHEANHGVTDAKCLDLPQALSAEGWPNARSAREFHRDVPALPSSAQGREFNIIDWKHAGGHETFNHNPDWVLAPQRPRQTRLRLLPHPAK